MSTTLPTQTGDRTPAIFLHIGAKRTGKTQGTLDMIADMVRMQGIPVLIMDVGNQAEYRNFGGLAIEDIGRWESLVAAADVPIFRVSTYEYDLFFEYLLAYVRNSMVVFEDATSYMTGNLSNSAKNLILQSRNMGNEYIFNLHSLAEPAPFLFRHSEYIILRQTLDNIKKLKSSVPVPHLVVAAMEEIIEENRGKEYKLAYRLIRTQEL